MGDFIHPVRVPAQPPAPFSREERESVSLALARVVESPPFRRSSRCREFLTFIVEQAVEGHLDMLKERSIGLALFGRDAGYETADDSIVRVRANEVRKRLAQFYLENADEPVEFILPVGSYVPQIRFREPLAATGEPAAAAPAAVAAVLPAQVLLAAQQRPRRWMWVAGAAALVCCAAALARFAAPARTPVEEFWAPVAASPRPALIWAAAGSFMKLKVPLMRQLTGANGEAVDLHIGPRDFQHIDRYVSPGGVYSLVGITQALTKLGRPPEYRLMDDITIAEYGNRPLILVGIYSNPWTLDAIRDWRYQFTTGRDHRILDTRTPGRFWQPPPQGHHEYEATIDYALVTRVFRTDTHQPMVVLGGFMHFGTQASAEFVTNPTYWKDALARLPKDWPRRNIQIVLETRVVRSVPGPPKVLDAYAW